MLGLNALQSLLQEKNCTCIVEPFLIYLSPYVITCFLYVSASALRAHLQLMIFPVADLQFAISIDTED
jgi:hypothetical protein